MSVWLTRLSRPRLALSMLLVLFTGVVVSCDGVPHAVTGPSTGSTLSPAAPHRDVVAGQFAHFYIGAFVDDWPLFMGDRVPASLNSASEVVFVFTNSGDKNLGMTYVQTREAGGVAALDSVLQLTGAWTCAARTVNAHPIRRCTKGPAVAYYMRLPDGAPTGEGYGTRGSMAQLRDGAQATISAIDGSTTYTSWGDVVSTVRGIVDVEDAGQGAPYTVVNSFEYDRTINPSDHTDHLATADAVNAASASRSWNVNWFVGFHAQVLAANLAQADHDVKQAAFYGYDEIVGGAGYGHPKYDSDVQLLLWRTYFRSSTSVPAPPPNAPSGLAGTAVSAVRTDLSWTNNTTIATGITIESAPDVGGAPGTFAVVGTVGPTATTFSVTTQTAATTYWYRVQARNSTDVSLYSNTITVTTQALPAAPSALAAAPVNSSRITLTWTDNATNETGFTIQRAPDVAGAAGTFATVTTTAANVTTYTNTGLTGSTPYWYRVRAVNGTDASAYTTAVTATTLVAPPAPTNLIATAISASRIDLSWSDAGSEISYTLDRAPDNGSGAPGTFATIATPAANVTSYSDQAALASGTRYWYRIRANVTNDNSAYTPATSATTVATAPNAPTSLAATTASQTAINLTWVDASTNETGFVVERAADSSGLPGTFTALLTLPANTTSYANTGLLVGTRYWYRVRATNAVGSSAYTANASATTLTASAVLTDFYIHAHEDDWQLFMGERASTSLQTASKVVFVYTSAGDANLGAPYWQVRETASMNAVDALLAGTGWTCAPQAVNGHSITRCARGIAVAYYLRLPDGATSGEGFGGRGSMSQLRDGDRASLAAMDGSATYGSWTDLTSTVRGIVDLESGNGTAPAVSIHAPEYDRTTNVGDHPDHLATADLVHSASATRSWNIEYHVDYRTQNLAVNLSQAVHDIKVNAFYAYDYTVGRAGYGYSQFESNYQAWLWRDYSRHVTTP